MTNAIASAALPRSTRFAATGAASVSVHADVAGALQAWTGLEAIAPVSLYQTQRWLLPWIATLGKARGITPMLIVVCDAQRPVLLLPFGVERRNGLNIAGFLGAKDSNFNLALRDPAHAFSAVQLRAILAEAAALAPTKPDVFLLSNQPESWGALPNPFFALPHQPSPSFGYKTGLTGDAESFLRTRISKDTRRKLGQKERRLAGLGALTFVHGASPEAVPAIIAVFCSQQSARLRAMGLHDIYESPAAAEFLVQASIVQPGQPQPALEWHALLCGTRIVATFAGGVAGERFHGMVTSFDGAADVSTSSPGDLLIQHLVAQCCQRGIATFDLGVGEARYKATYCDAVEPLFDCLIPASLKGHVWAGAEKWRLAAKRAIKQSPLAWSLARRVRALRG